jgi:amino acid transporter
MINKKGQSSSIGIAITTAILVVFTIVIVFSFLINNSGIIVINKYGEEKFVEMQNEIDSCNDELYSLSDSKQIVCQCKTDNGTWWLFIIGGFMVGVMATIYTIWLMELGKYFVKENKNDVTKVKSKLNKNGKK